MTRRPIHTFWRDESGAVAAIYAVSLMGLVSIAGVGYDYARMAGLDSELQNGADQAALAGATQLDGDSGACARAGNAAVGMLRNLTLLANDNLGNTVKVNGSGTIAIDDDQCSPALFGDKVKFYEADQSTPATTDSAARFVKVDVDARTAQYAFTPIVGAYYATMNAGALAGVSRSVCKVPPVMMCNPAEAATNTDKDYPFDADSYTGDGVLLLANSGNAGGAYAAGNFGYLETNAGNGAQATSQTLGMAEIPGDCAAADDVTTKPGLQVSVLDALNTRFDIYANGLNNACGTGKGTCPPSANSRKDVVLLSSNASSCANGCGFQSGAGGNNVWKEAPAPYLPTSATTPISYTGLSPMGYPRDMCHAVNGSGGSCSGGRIGDGNWDRAAYFGTNTTNYPTPPTSSDLIGMFGTDTPTRYEVYKYEADNAATRLKPQPISGGYTAYGQPAPDSSVGVAVDGTDPDRRVLSVAVINCQAQNVKGTSTGVHVVNWVDVFLVEPAVARARTAASDIYVEVIGKTRLGGGSAVAQSVSKAKPYLVE